MNNFRWLDLENKTSLTKCRNSVQGQHLIADEKGMFLAHFVTIMWRHFSKCLMLQKLLNIKIVQSMHEDLFQLTTFLVVQFPVYNRYQNVTMLSIERLRSL